MVLLQQSLAGELDAPNERFGEPPRLHREDGFTVAAPSAGAVSILGGQLPGPRPDDERFTGTFRDHAKSE